MDTKRDFLGGALLILFVGFSDSAPGLHQKQHGQWVEGGDSAPLLHSGETPPGVLCPALEPLAQERHGPVGVGPEEAAETI